MVGFLCLIAEAGALPDEGLAAAVEDVQLYFPVGLSTHLLDGMAMKSKAIIPHLTWSFLFLVIDFKDDAQPINTGDMRGVGYLKTPDPKRGQRRTLGTLTLKTVFPFLVPSIRNEVEMISLYLALWTILNYGARGVTQSPRFGPKYQILELIH